MAISPIVITSDASNNYRATVPVSLTSAWKTILDAPGPALQDGANITNPDTQIIFVTTHLFRTGSVGTTLLLRIGYDDALTAITDCVVRVFGRCGATDEWMLLKNVTGGTEFTLTTASSDSTDGTLKYSTVDPSLTACDLLGCNEILVGVQTAFSGTGDLTNCIIQAKVI